MKIRPLHDRVMVRRLEEERKTAGARINEAKQAIERAIADKARIIRIPVHVNEKIKKIARVSRELGETLGRKPTPEEAAETAMDLQTRGSCSCVFHAIGEDDVRGGRFREESQPVTMEIVE